MCCCCIPCCTDEDDIDSEAMFPVQSWADLLMMCACCPVVAYMCIHSKIEARRWRAANAKLARSVTAPPKPVLPPEAPPLNTSGLKETEEIHSEMVRDEQSEISPPNPPAKEPLRG